MRKRLGWTQTEAAQRLGLKKYQTVSGYERGTAEPKRAILALLAGFCEGSGEVLAWLEGGRGALPRIIPREGPPHLGEDLLPLEFARHTPETSIRLQVMAEASRRVMAEGDTVPRLLVLKVLEDVSIAWAAEEARRSGAVDADRDRRDDGDQRRTVG